MKNIFSFLTIAVVCSLVNAQVNVQYGVQNNFINESNVAIDLSGSFSNEAGAGPYQGKGVIIPSVDLVNFEFNITLADGVTFPTWFDGMIVYNNASGTTLTTGQRSSTPTVVTPGFYYFYNPTGSSTSSVQPGVWRVVGADTRVNIVDAETRTNTLINNSQVYTIRGTFTASGNSTAVNIPSPTGMTALYSITIYGTNTGMVYSRSLYSYTIGTTVGNAITGAPNMSTIYPAGTYNYVMEYIK